MDEYNIQNGKRVLVVDDNVDAADSLAALLTQAGYEVETLYDGREALAAARARHPRIVLLDLGMPGLDGYQVAEQLRHDEASANVRLIAVSGYGQEQDRSRSRAAGFDHHLVKPVDGDALLALMR